MTIVSGSLTLPNQLTVQGWLAQFFSTPPDDYGMNTNQLADDGLLSVFTIEAPPGTVFGFSEATVTLTLNGGILSDALAKDRSIAFLSISTPDGKTMLIEFVSPKSASEYFDLLDGGNGAQAFYESIQPNISGFYSQTGSDGDDFMEGFASDDTFVGGLGNDSFRGGGGDDRIDGGDGVDVALWVAEARNFEFKIERLTNAEIEAGNAQMTLTG